MSSGDYQLGAVVYLPFTTRAFATGVPTVLSGTPVIEIYEDASVAQITVAETLVVSIDAIVGFNMCSVVASGANGFGVGQSYTAIISAGTVGGVSVVGEVIGHFTVEKSAAHLRLGSPAGASIAADIAVVEIDTNELQGDWVDGGRLDLILDARMAEASINTTAGVVDSVSTVAVTTVNTDMRGTDGVDTAAMRGTDLAALASVATEARLAELDAANIPADVGAILLDTSTTLETHLTDMKGATFAGATDSLEAIRNRGDIAWITGGGGGGGSDSALLQSTTIATLASQTLFTLTAGSADNGAYDNMLLIVTDSVTSAQKAVGVILSYVGATRTVTLREDPAVFVMAAGDAVDVIAISPDIAVLQSVATEARLAELDAANLPASVDNLPTLAEFTARTLLSADYFDPAVDAVANVTTVGTTTINTDMRGTDGVDTAAMRGTDLAALASVATEARLAELDAANIPADVNAILLDTNELQTDDVPGLIAALNDLSAAAVNAEMVDVMSVDTFAEPTGVPPAIADLATKIGYVFMALRNQIDISATKKTFYDDSGLPEWEKDLTDDGTTYSESEANII